MFTDPSTGRRYTADPVTGTARWLDPPPPPDWDDMDEDVPPAALRRSGAARVRRVVGYLAVIAVALAVGLVVAARIATSMSNDGTMQGCVQADVILGYSASEADARCRNHIDP